MRVFMLIGLFLSFSTAQVGAESLKKAYFAATLPGSWAKYESSWTMKDGMTGSNLYTYIRVPDSEGRVRIELEMETVSGPGKGMINRQLHVMGPGFDLVNNFLSYMSFLEASIIQSGKNKPMIMQDDSIEAMRKSGENLTNAVTFKDKADMQGRKCDYYTYASKSGGGNAMLNEGELWLDESVPFGIVLQKGKVTKESGELVSTFVQKLLDSGTGKTGTAELLALTPKPKQTPSGKASSEAPQSLSLLKAYQTEKIRLLVEVKKDRRLMIQVKNKTKAPFDIVVPKGPLAVDAGSPLEVLRFVVDKEERFSLPPNGVSPSFTAGQSGNRGATEGKFELTVHEGETLFMGSVKVGPL